MCDGAGRKSIVLMWSQENQGAFFQEGLYSEKIEAGELWIGFDRVHFCP